MPAPKSSLSLLSCHESLYGPLISPRPGDGSQSLNLHAAPASNDVVLSSVPAGEDGKTLTPEAVFLNHVATASTYQRFSSIFQDSILLVNGYTGILSRVLSIYDGRFSPFRAAALSTWRRSPLLFSAFRYFVGIYLSGPETDCRLCVVVNEARIGLLGQLSSSLLAISSSIPFRKTEILFVVCMFGLSSSWYDLKDLGLQHYDAATALLPEVQQENSNVAPRTAQFFSEFLVYWWMMLSFACDPGSHDIRNPPAICRRKALEPRMPHPLTGVSPESQILLGMVGRLVLSQRKMALQQPGAAAGALLCSLSNLEKPRELERQLISLELPQPNMVLDPEDPHTPVHDLINIAQAYRLCGLLLLYRTYPDLLAVNVANDASHGTGMFPGWKHETNPKYLVSLAIHILQVLGQNSRNSGTRTIEAILLVIVSSELSQNNMNFGDSKSQTQCDICSQLPAIIQCHEFSNSHRQLTMMEARSLLIARFERIQAVLPFNTIRHMKSLVLETWRLMDQGLDVFWVDLLIKNNWQFVMI